MAGKNYTSKLVIDFNVDGSVEGAYRTTTTELTVGDHTIKDQPVDGLSLPDLSVMLAALIPVIDAAAKAQSAQQATADADRAAAQAEADARTAASKASPV